MVLVENCLFSSVFLSPSLSVDRCQCGQDEVGAALISSNRRLVLLSSKRRLILMPDLVFRDDRSNMWRLDDTALRLSFVDSLFRMESAV